jgi:DNA repair protein RecO (recombination protein O)
MRIELQPAYVLHSRPFRDSSLLVDLLTRDHGRLTLIAKGARNPKQSQRQLLQVLVPLSISWQGKSELKTLIGIEPVGNPFSLEGLFLYSAFYANELLTYLLAQGDSVTDIYELYSNLLSNLQEKKDLELTLRDFEFSLLNFMGYGINFELEASEGMPIAAEKYYGFMNEAGFFPENMCSDKTLAIYQGAHLLAISEGRYDHPLTRKLAKKITRIAFSILLQGKVIKSREFFN